MHACVCVCLGGEGQDIDQSGWGKCFYFFSLPVSTEEEGGGAHSCNETASGPGDGVS